MAADHGLGHCAAPAIGAASQRGALAANHANFCASDVVALSGIFARHFSFEVSEANADYALLHGRDGFFLVITRIGADAPQIYPTGFHVGFMVERADEVVAKHAELSEAGRRPGPIKTFTALGADWTTFMCPVGDGIAIEVNARRAVERRHG